jgi:hypothetical protein
MWKSWHQRLKRAKGRMADADIAAAVEEILQQTVRPNYSIKRAVVNHWLNGRRIPTLSEFFALCQVVGADPGEVLFGERVLQTYVKSDSQTARVLQHRASEPVRPYDPVRKVLEFKAKRRTRRHTTR